jgi:hypothetical protein
MDRPSSYAMRTEDYACMILVSNHTLHRTAAGASVLYALDLSDAGFAAGARFRRRSVS